MRERSIIIICIVAILCVTAASATVIILHDNNQTNNTSNNSTVNVTLNDTQNNTTNNTTKTTTSTKKSSSKNYDPDYDPTRDKSHQGATKDNPITVQQSDGVYTYYGPGHYDYYAGDNHMSGGYYKEMNNRKY